LGDLLDRKIFLSCPRVDNAEILHYVGTVKCVLSQRAQFAGPTTLTNRVLFSPQTGVNQTEHAERRPVIRLFTHIALGFGTRGRKSLSCSHVVAESARDTTLNEDE